MRGRSPKEEAAHMGHVKVAKLFKAFAAKSRSPLYLPLLLRLSLYFPLLLPMFLHTPLFSDLLRNNEVPEGVMANNFSHTLSDLLSPTPASTLLPKDLPNSTPVFNMGLAHTLGHFHTLLAPPKSKLKIPKPKPKSKTQPKAAIKQKALSPSHPLTPPTSSNKSKSLANLQNGDKSGNGREEEDEKNGSTYDYGSGGRSEESFSDEESDSSAGVNLDYSVSELDDDDISVTSDSASLHMEPVMTSRSVRPLINQAEDDSVDLIAEIVINKL